MSLTLDIQLASQADNIPTEAQFTQWASAALAGQRKEASEISLRIVDSAEIQQLNAQYRHKNQPTNVLSFPAEFPEGLCLPLLGDIVICAPIIAAEAKTQGKTESAHWAHMTIHGTLHLLGYDHIETDEAEAMEALEAQILNKLGYPNPYEQE